MFSSLKCTKNKSTTRYSKTFLRSRSSTEDSANIKGDSSSRFIMMPSFEKFELLIWFLQTMCLIGVSVGFDPVDNYLLDCGSFTNTPVGNRVFIADNPNSSFITSPHSINANTSSASITSNYGSALYQTARIFTETSTYRFPIKNHGRHWIRLYFFPFEDSNYNLFTAKFSVSTQGFTLLKDFQPQIGSSIKEFSLNITSEELVLTFTPIVKSVAFLSALEVVSLPNELIPNSAQTVDPSGIYRNLHQQALQTVARVNMGNKVILPQNDTLNRYWDADAKFLRENNLAAFVSKIEAVNYTRGISTPDIAPTSVYGTATKLNVNPETDTNANVTWHFNVEPGFDYLVRFHFCDIVSSAPKQLLLNVYINSWYVSQDLDLSSLSSNTLGSPYFIDIVTRSRSDIPVMNVSVGPSASADLHLAILNGLEIMKINNSRGEFDPSNDSKQFSKTVGVIVGSCLGASIALILAIVLFWVFRRRKLARDNNSRTQNKWSTMNGTRVSDTKKGYQFPLVVVQEATNDFSELIGEGGFGKVYKGILRDKTKVAVKKGNCQCQHGIAEFRTEIEMLSQFRHRHLVNLIGYCDEQKELIIIYDFMENGALKNHLYGSNLPKLSWTQRLKICIESARGIHYLHTGSMKAIIHRDVKSANILLDENLVAKVADFGLSKVGPEIDETHVSTAVKGSFGYLDPEYLARQQLTEKSDVYSFGVVMFEVLCGRPVFDPSLPKEMVNLVEWALKYQQKGNLEEIIDPYLVGNINLDSLRKFGEIAGKCLAEHGIERPTMGDVLWNLEYALQLQGKDEFSENVVDVNELEKSVSITTAEFSRGGGSEFDNFSMNRVFSQMLKAKDTD